MRYRISHPHSCGFNSFQNTRKFCFNYVGCTTPTIFFIILQGIAGATDVSNFLRAFLMVSLNSLSSGSIKWIPSNFRAFSRWSFSSDHPEPFLLVKKLQKYFSGTYEFQKKKCPHEITVITDDPDFYRVQEHCRWCVGAHIQAVTFSSQDHGRLSIVRISEH